MAFNKVPPQFTRTAACDGISSTNWGCCSNSAPCGVGCGDCDSYDDCQGDLDCGESNCKNDYSLASSNWDSSADCYVRKYIFLMCVNHTIVSHILRYVVDYIIIAAPTLIILKAYTIRDHLAENNSPQPVTFGVRKAQPFIWKVPGVYWTKCSV